MKLREIACVLFAPLLSCACAIGAVTSFDGLVAAMSESAVRARSKADNLAGFGADLKVGVPGRWSVIVIPAGRFDPLQAERQGLRASELTELVSAAGATGTSPRMVYLAGDKVTVRELSLQSYRVMTQFAVAGEGVRWLRHTFSLRSDGVAELTEFLLLDHEP